MTYFWFSLPLRWFHSPCPVTSGMSAPVGIWMLWRTERRNMCILWGDQPEQGPQFTIVPLLQHNTAWVAEADPFFILLSASNFLHMLLNRHTSPSILQPRPAEMPPPHHRPRSRIEDGNHETPQKLHFSAQRKVTLLYHHKKKLKKRIQQGEKKPKQKCNQA